MDLSLLIIHYHTPSLAAECVAALRASLAEADLAALDCEIVLVDNGSDPAGRELLASLPVHLVEPGSNLGYAGGLGLAMERSTGERVVVLNPDVLVTPGCLPRLLEELDGVASSSASAADVVGPRFYLDRQCHCRIPPTEPRTRRWELRSVLADRGQPWTRVARRVWRRHALRHWRAVETFDSISLSGALLAFSRSVWERVGPFDPTLPLYFEEDDWLQRVRRRGLVARYVPAAEAVHLHGRSTAEEPRAAAWFAHSREIFRRRWYGGAFSRVLTRMEPGAELRLPWPCTATCAPDGRPRLPLSGISSGPSPASSNPGWVELSPSPRGFPAAALFLRDVSSPAGCWELPESVWCDLAPGTYRLQWVDGRGREGVARSFTRPARVEAVPEEAP